MQGECDGRGASNAAFALPGATPWRTITVGSSLKPIVETTVSYDVVEPLYEASEQYKPGRYIWSWLIWRFIAGIGCAMIWVVVESALMCSGNARNRGRLLAAYMMVYYMGTVLGQLLVSTLPTGLMDMLPWVTGLVLAAILPLLFTRIVNEQGEQQGATRVWPMLRLRQARLGVNGCTSPASYWGRSMA